MIPVLLGIGSNIEPEKNIPLAMKKLRELDEKCRFSRVFESEPVGFVGANVFNLVAEIHTKLPITELITKLKEIEKSQGKAANAKKSHGCTVDIDLLTYGELCQKQAPCLPREDIYNYAFVLLPLAELCPDRLIPGDSRTFAEAWSQSTLRQKLIPAKAFLSD